MSSTQKYALEYLYLYVVMIRWNIDTPQGGKQIRKTQINCIDSSAMR